MIKLPPRIYVNHIKGEGLETVGVYRTYSSKGYRVLNAEYIRRDLIQTILIRVHLHEARRDDIKLDQIIDEVIENTNQTQNDN